MFRILSSVFFLGMILTLGAAPTAASRVCFMSGDMCGRFEKVKASGGQTFKTVFRKTRYGKVGDLLVSGPVGSAWQEMEISFVPDKSDMIRMILTSGKSNQWVEYTGFSAVGSRLDNGDFSRREKGMFWLWAAHPVSLDDGFCAANFRVGVEQSFRVTKGVPVTIRFKARAGKKRPFPAARKRFDYNSYHKYPGAPLRYKDKNVKLLDLAHKGLTPETHPADAWWYVVPKTKVSPVEFRVLPGKNAGDLKIPFELLEEDGIARKAPIRMGIPLAEGKFRQLGGLTVTDPAGKKIPAQFSAIAFWPDGSVKAALVQFAAPLKARERSVWHVVSGKAPLKKAVSCQVKNSGGRVDTGCLRAEVLPQNKFFRQGKTSAQIILTDEAGKKQLFVPQKIQAEEQGNTRVTLRLEGHCGDSFKAVLRLGFFADSSVVTFDMRFINDVLKSEFTDIASLELVFDDLPAKKIVMDGMSGKKFFQYHDKKLERDGKFSQKRLSGSGRAGGIAFHLNDFWQKYPKSVSIAGNSLVFGLLPAQPDKDFNKELPFYLRYPFCGGFYRSKWGMAFSEQLKIDFSGKEKMNVREIVPVIDRDYLASTGVFQGVPAKSCRQFEIFDKRAEEAFSKISAEREIKREYGFMNWGDSFGERGFNWNNNEYDLPRGLFQLFLRNGNRDLYRYARISSRHQADVDIVHASIMKSNIGGQHQHGIGHSGPSWHHFRPLPWSYPHDANSTGVNGHTWTEGLLTSWCLAGDAFVMDSAQLMAAHYVNYIAPSFINMRNNERSIGWALRALMPFYRVTGDKKYLRAAKDMVDVVLHEYEPSHGGAWPHRLRGGHANGHKEAWGSCPFMVGVLLEGLRQYQLAAQDPEVEKMLQGAARWLYKSYSPADIGWPYGVSWDGKGYHEPFVQCNFEILSGMLAGMPKSYSAVADVIGQAALGGISSTPKDFSMVLNMSGGILDGLCKVRPDLNAPIDGSQLWKSVASAPSKFKMRGPLKKKFLITVTGKNPKVVLKRTRYGNRPNGAKEYSLVWEGQTVKGKTATAHACHIIRPAGEKGRQVTVVINDDMTSYWDVESSADAKVEAVLVPGYHLVAEGAKAYSFRVPAGTEKFSVTVAGTHRGGFAAAVLDPQGRIAGSVTGRNDGDVQLPWTQKIAKNRPEKTFVICPPASSADTCWKIVLLSGGGALLSLDGVPPLISRIE